MSETQAVNSLLKKLHTIMAEVDFINTDTKHSLHGYGYASEESIKKRLRGKFVEHGVLFQLNAFGIETERRTDEKGTENIITHVDFGYKFIDVATGETLEGQFVGSGEDAGEKGVYQAVTSAIKYILTSTFLIPTGDDPESDGDNGTTTESPTTEQREGNGVNAIRCDKCGNDMIVKKQMSTGHEYYGCTNYPDCKNTKPIKKASDDGNESVSQFDTGLAEEVSRFFDELGLTVIEIAAELKPFDIASVSDLPKLSDVQLEKLKNRLSGELDQHLTITES